MGMSIAIDRAGRDALWSEAMVELSAIGDIYSLASRPDIEAALALRVRQQRAMGVLDAVGWGEHDDRRQLALLVDPWQMVSGLVMITESAAAGLTMDGARDDDGLRGRRELAIATCVRAVSQIANHQLSAQEIGGVS